MQNRLSQDLDHVLAHTESLWAEARGERLFLTGGSGFVGTWLLESLLWANRRLGLNVSAVLLTRNPAAFLARSPHLAADPAVTVLAGDVSTFAFPAGAFPLVIHAATERYFEPDSDRPLSTFSLDIEGTRRVLEFARSHGTRRLLFTSSGAVYGKQPAELTHIPEDYTGAPMTVDTGSAYGQAKRASEFLCSMYARQYGFDALIARLFAFAGPVLPLDQNFAVGNFIRDALGGGPILVKGDGAPYRSYLYAADLAIWLWTILFRGKSARPYNVGSDRMLTITELARTIVLATAPGASIEIARKPVLGVPPLRYVPSVKRAESELGLRPIIPVEECVRRMYAWARQSVTEQVSTGY